MLQIPIVQRMLRVDPRVAVVDVSPQDVISRDNVSVRVTAVVNFWVLEPAKCVLQIAQTRLRSVLGQHEPDDDRLAAAARPDQVPDG